jgi:hypothetical protein
VQQDRLQNRVRRQVASLIAPDDDIRFVILTSTIVPNRNWFLLVTGDEFIVVRVAHLRLRAIDINERPPTLLSPRTTPTLRRSVTIGITDHYVSRTQLRQVRAHNDDYINNTHPTHIDNESHAAKIAALRREVKDYERSLADIRSAATRSDDALPSRKR